jgi:hypothetical protein
MRTIIAFLMMSQWAAAAQLFDAEGKRTAAGSGEARTIEEWCDLATAAESYEARRKYATTLVAIEATPPLDLSPAEIEAARFEPGRIEQFRKRLAPSEALALRRAGLVLLAGGPKLLAVKILHPVADESCLSELFKVTPDAVGRASDETRLADNAEGLIAEIGGKKAIAGLVSTARIRFNDTGNMRDGSHWKRCRRAAAMVALGECRDSGAVDALKTLRRYFGPQSSEAFQIDASMKRWSEKHAAADDAKILAAKPGH